MNEETGPVEVDTLLYGGVTLNYGHDEITGTYREGQRTTVRVRRLGERTHNRTPIGTRSSANVCGTIDARAITFDPGRARVLKRSYRVGIRLDGRVLTLAATNLEDSALIVGPSDNGDNVFGMLTRTFGGHVDVMWSPAFRLGRRQIEPPTPTRDDALVGVVTAAAFGTGGLSASTIVMGLVASIFP